MNLKTMAGIFMTTAVLVSCNKDKSENNDSKTTDADFQYEAEQFLSLIHI